ncbi:RDD family protein [Lysobacter niastensis]|uniref:RDD family protein n=1 Tax=Lysobacter niastensis TaxID=380629 RepID=A0ABS0B7N4_9GAMM|nr:RDD family protein [Lysobacter niastensis]MBF6023009.1 RDD family protein [Lysobacter niastensis]
MSQWYYSDYDRNRHGPVSAGDLAELHAHGQLSPDTLVWREGLAQWQPWSSLVGEVIAGAGRPAVSSASFATAAASAPASIGANPYSVAEPASPYAPPRAALHDASDYDVGGEIVYAGFWKRLAAYFIDSFVLIVLIGILGAIFGVLGVMSLSGLGDASAMSSGGLVFFAVFYVLEIAIMVAYFAIMHASSSQATLGKMAVGIKVTDEDGRRISLARGIGRFFATIPSSLILFIGYVMAAFTDRKRALHDMIAGTLVVDRWAYTSHPERQRDELGTVTIVILVIGGLLMLAYLGVMALVGVAAGIAASGGAS